MNGTQKSTIEKFKHSCS